jgi:chromosome segregation ATPase
LIVSAAEYQALLSDLQRVRFEEYDRVSRIRHLEQALDQALESLAEMRQELQEKSFLESQLAATEKFASVQQQAIARLRMRAQQQQQIIESHLARCRETVYRSPRSTDSRVGEMAPPLPDIPLPAATIEPCQAAALTPDADCQRVADLEQQLEQAHALSERLQARLVDAQQRIQELSLAVDEQRARETAEAQPPTAPQKEKTRPRRSPSPQQWMQKKRAIATLGQDFALAQIKVEELEMEVARQMRQQALWQQRYHEAKGESDSYRTRIHTLDEQTAEMQEQVFQQAQQIGEYEAAVQHWKDQYAVSQSQINRLQELLEEMQLRFLANEPGDPTFSALFSELLAVVEFSRFPLENELQPLPVRHLGRANALDMPEFLLRRRTYRPQ